MRCEAILQLCCLKLQSFTRNFIRLLVSQSHRKTHSILCGADGLHLVTACVCGPVSCYLPVPLRKSDSRDVADSTSVLLCVLCSLSTPGPLHVSDLPSACLLPNAEREVPDRETYERERTGVL